MQVRLPECPYTMPSSDAAVQDYKLPPGSGNS